MWLSLKWIIHGIGLCEPSQSVLQNINEGLYSKCLARANVAGNLVIDFADETCLVCIRYGRFTITRQIAADAANIFDNRLLVCL